MPANIERTYREALAVMSPDDPHYGFLSSQLREIEVEFQLDYLDFDKFPTTEKQVKAELARQAERYIDFGLNEYPEVNLPRASFKNKLTALAQRQPENFADRFRIPVAVLGQVPPKEVYEAAGVGYYLDGLDVRDWSNDPKGYVTPGGFYLTWMMDGARNLDRKVEDVRAGLAADTRGATEADGSALYVAHPRILTHHFIDFPGTSVGRDDAPCLHVFRGGPEVGGGWVGYAHPGFGSALCGRD